MIEASLHLRRRDFTLDVRLALPVRGVSALFGPSGCGKTTVLRALAGLERAAGRVALGDEVWQDDAAKVFVPTHARPLGYVIQEAALFPHLSVAGNLDYGRRRSAGGVDMRVLDGVVELLGIGALLERRPATLSGGERQRVAMARALATGPRLLLMDEPLAALDAARKAEILPYLERLHRELAVPIVYVTHAMDEVARLADHLVLLSQGSVLATGSLVDVLSRTDLPIAQAAHGHDESGVVIEAQVAEHDMRYGLSRIAFAGGSLWLGGASHAAGERVRARVLARDVSVTRQAPQQTSILNVLAVTVEDVHIDGNTVLLRLAVGTADGTTRMLARITRKSSEALALRRGDRLFAQVKAVALT
jgi:molybdate transport system ATP-binding protein